MGRRRKNKSKEINSHEGTEGQNVNSTTQLQPKESRVIDKLAFNEKFAQQYDESKRRQLLSNTPGHLLDDSEDSSSSEEEDEFGEMLTKGIDRQVKATLEAIRKKDPRIYNKDVKFFENPKQESNSEQENDDDDSEVDNSDDEPVAGWDIIAKAAQEATPKLTLKDYVRETLLKDGKLSDSDDENEEQTNMLDNEREQDTTVTGDRNNFETNKELSDDEMDGKKVSFDEDNDSEEASDDDAFFTKKEKTEAELEEEEKDFEAFLKVQAKTNSKRVGEDLLLHSYLENEKPDEKERFLRDFVLNNGWLDGKGEEAPHAKDYEIEIDLPNTGSNDEDDEDKDEEFDDKADNFEAEYNFRFEDPSGTQIVSHARNVSDSMRRPDDRRKRARAARQLRKQQEKATKAEDIKRLKNLKKKEVKARLLAIEEAAGDGIDMTGIDLDADFDPDKFNKQMESKFGDEYYSKADSQMEQLQHTEDGIASEKRLVPERSEEVTEDVREDLNKLMDEYYNLDYEDIVGGVPVRFNYKQVQAESFNLTPSDILGMEDKELNRLVSLKYLAPYRSVRDVKKQAWKVEKQLQNTKKRRRSDGETKEDQELETGDAATEEQHSSKWARKRAKKQKKKKSKETRDVAEDVNSSKPNGIENEQEEHSTVNNKIDQDANINETTTEGKEKKSSGKSKRDKKKKRKASLKNEMSSSRREAYGIN